MLTTYRDFGPIGAVFNVAYSNVEELTQWYWERRDRIRGCRTVPNEPTDFRDAAAASVTPTTIWINAAVSLEHFGVSRDQVADLWSRMTRMYSAPLMPWQEI